ncbi:MAG: hypothetical protein ACPGWR_22140, partial [Ardenticatenaceae bacterium]
EDLTDLWHQYYPLNPLNPLSLLLMAETMTKAHAPFDFRAGIFSLALRDLTRKITSDLRQSVKSAPDARVRHHLRSIFLC